MKVVRGSLVLPEGPPVLEEIPRLVLSLPKRRPGAGKTGQGMSVGAGRILHARFEFHQDSRCEVLRCADADNRGTSSRTKEDAGACHGSPRRVIEEQLCRAGARDLEL